MTAMTTTWSPAPHVFEDPLTINRRVTENVVTLMHRIDASQQDLAEYIGIGQATISRRLKNRSMWLNWEVAAIANLAGVTMDEMSAGLPPFEEWQARWDELCACRDSNPKPSDLYPALRLVGLCACCPDGFHRQATPDAGSDVAA